MKKIVAATLFCLILLLNSKVYATDGAAPDISNAGGAVVIERDSLRIILEKDKDKKLPEASTKKIMTAILAIEKGNLSDIVTVSGNASGVEGSSIWLAVGERITLENLLYGLMLSSGNDAAVAVAEHISGSVDAFVAEMNGKARELGALNTNFVNPNGLYNENHYTTAYDLALIAAYAMKNETFRTIVSTVYREMPWEGHEYNRVLKNKNRNLWQYEGATGIKTGYTKDSGRCFVGSAMRDGIEFITVLLDDYDMFANSREVLDYGFTNYQKVNIVNEGDPLGPADVANGIPGAVELLAGGGYSFPLTGEESASIRKVVTVFKIAAPVSAGQEVGKIEVFLGDQKITEIPVLAGGDVIENSYEYNLNRIIENYIYG